MAGDTGNDMWNASGVDLWNLMTSGTRTFTERAVVRVLYEIGERLHKTHVRFRTCFQFL